MSQASIPSPPQAIKNPPKGAAASPAKPILTLADMVSQAAKDLKRVELAKTILGLSIIVCLLGLALILVDHWVWPLPTYFRWCVLVLTCTISVFWVLRQLIPMLGRSINPIFAARQIETKVPELKDSLVSYMQLNDGESHTPKGVVTAIGRFAVERLSRHDVSEFVSSSTPLRLGIWLFAILILSSIYFIVSPKSGLDSLLRLAMPWHSINAPTRVKIIKVSPQDVVIARGQSVEVEVEVQGLLQKDPIQIEFSSLDGQFVDRKIEMREEVNGMIYRGSLSMGERGILQDLEYRIRAGDVVAGPFHVTLEQMPVISIEKLEFAYPRYTRLAPSQSNSTASFSAVEGTKVIVLGKSNQEMKSGQIEVAERAVGDAPAENRRSYAMTAQKESLSGTFQLLLNKKNENPSAFTYRISATSRLGQATQDPAAHEFQVIKDESPLVNWGVEYPETLELPINQQTDFVITASDPDFGLSQIRTELVRGRSKLDEKILLKNAEGIRQPVTRTWRFEPVKMGLRPGDELTLQAEASDNRRDINDTRWEPNKTVSRTLKIKIVAEQKKPTQFSAPEQQMKPLDQQPVDGSDVQKPEKQESQKTENANSEQGADPGKDGKSDAAESPQNGNDTGEQQGATEGATTDKPAKDGQEPSEQGANASSTDGKSEKQNETGNAEQSDKQGAAESGKSAGDKQGNQAGKQNGGVGDQSKDNKNSPNGNDNKQQQSGGSGEAAQGQKSDGNANQNDSSSGAGGGEQNQSGENGQGAQSQGQGQPGANSQSGGGGESGGGGGQPDGQANSQSNGSSGGNGQSGGGGGQPGKSDSGSGKPSGDGSKGGASKGQPGDSSNSGESSASDDNGANNGGAGGSNSGKDSSSDQSPSSGGGKSNKSSGGNSSNTPGGESSNSGGSQSGNSSSGNSQSGTSSPQQGGSTSSPGNGNKGRLDNVERGSRNPDTPMHDGEAFEEINQWMKEHGDPKAVPDSEKRKTDVNAKTPAADINEQGNQQSNPGQAQSQEDNSNSNPNSPANNLKEGGNPAQGSAQNQSANEAEKNGQPSGNQPPKNSDKASVQSKGGKDGSESGEKGGQEAGSGSANGQSQNGNQPGTGATGAPSGAGGGTSTAGNSTHGSGTGSTNAGPAKANVDYAKKVTDLALEYLDRQKDQPDPELLKRLGWTEEQLKAFQERWKKAREKGVTPDGTKQDYANDLRSLGIKPPTQSKRNSKGVDDKLNGLSEEGGRSKPPSTLQSQYDAFRKAAQQKPAKK